MSFATGSLVKARGREWVVLPGSEEDLLLLRPLGGTEDEVTGILPALEEVGPATFSLPDPADAEVVRLRVREVPAAHRRGGPHREAFGEADARALRGVEEDIA